MKNLKTLGLILLTALALAACSGKQGDPGPTGPAGDPGATGATGSTGADATLKNGSLQGTITGMRRDGTPISETFNYEYGDGDQFVISHAEKIINISRYSLGYSNYIELSLKIINEGTATENLIFDNNAYSGFILNFLKTLTPSQSLKISAQADLTDRTVSHFLSYQKNATYKFVLTDDDNLEYDYDYVNNKMIFYTTDNKKVLYNYTTGALISVLNANNTPAANAFYSLYNGLVYVNGGGFKDAATNADLTEIVQVKGDVGTITNYKYDAATGILSFDFTITIADQGRLNSTHHALTITGKFNSGGRVARDIVGRKGN